MPPAPCGELPTVMTFVKYECVEMMADGGLGLGESGVRDGALKIGQRHSSHGIAAQAPRSSKPLDEGCGGKVLGWIIAGGRCGTMGAEEMREVVRKVCRAEKMEEVGICEKEVTQNPCGVVLTRVFLMEEEPWKEVADLEKSLLANYTK